MSVNCISVDWFLYCPVVLQCITTEGNWVKNVGNLCYLGPTAACESNTSKLKKKSLKSIKNCL